MAGLSPIDLQRALRGANYPASRDDLATLARENGADNDTVDKLESLSQRRFEGPNEVSKALFGK